MEDVFHQIPALATSRLSSCTVTDSPSADIHQHKPFSFCKLLFAMTFYHCGRKWLLHPHPCLQYWDGTQNLVCTRPALHRTATIPQYNSVKGEASGWFTFWLFRWGYKTRSFLEIVTSGLTFKSQQQWVGAHLEWSNWQLQRRLTPDATHACTRVS